MDSVAFRRRAADFVARILHGTPPGELPIEQPTIFEFTVNLKTAKALGFTLTPSILIRADAWARASAPGTVHQCRTAA